MTMRDLSILRTLFLLIGLFGALSCSNTQSNSDYDPSIDFAGLKTFAWLPDQPQGRTRVLHTNGLRLDRVRKAIDQELEDKGLDQIGADKADFLIRALVTEELVTAETSKGHSGEIGSDPTDAMPKTRRSQRYENVALIVDFLEPGKQELIWRGTGEKRIERNTSADAREAAISELVSRILSRYPPPAV